MERLKLMLTGGIVAAATLALAMVLTITTMTELEPVQADVANQITVPAVAEEIHYAQLTDAQPQRDVTQQHFAPAVGN